MDSALSHVLEYARKGGGERKSGGRSTQQRILLLKISIRVKKKKKKGITLTASSRIIFRRLFIYENNKVRYKAVRTRVGKRQGNNSYDMNNMDF